MCSISCALNFSIAAVLKASLLYSSHARLLPKLGDQLASVYRLAMQRPLSYSSLQGLLD